MRAGRQGTETGCGTQPAARTQETERGREPLLGDQTWGLWVKGAASADRSRLQQPGSTATITATAYSSPHAGKHVFLGTYLCKCRHHAAVTQLVIGRCHLTTADHHLQGFIILDNFK